MTPPQGFAAPVNAWLRAARTPYVVVMNDDVEFDALIVGGPPGNMDQVVVSRHGVQDGGHRIAGHESASPTKNSSGRRDPARARWPVRLPPSRLRRPHGIASRAGSPTARRCMSEDSARSGRARDKHVLIRAQPRLGLGALGTERDGRIEQRRERRRHRLDDRREGLHSEPAC